MKSQTPPTVQVAVPWAGAPHAAQLTDEVQPVSGVLLAQTPLQKCSGAGHTRPLLLEAPTLDELVAPGPLAALELLAAIPEAALVVAAPLPAEVVPVEVAGPSVTPLPPLPLAPPAPPSPPMVSVMVEPLAQPAAQVMPASAAPSSAERIEFFTLPPGRRLSLLFPGISEEIGSDFAVDAPRHSPHIGSNPVALPIWRDIVTPLAATVAIPYTSKAL